MGNKLNLGVRLDLLPEFSAENVASLSILAENEGFDSVWIPEGISRDALTELAHVASKTSKITLGTGILPIFYRDPTMTAMSAAGMDAISNHRFILGLGLGHKHMVEEIHGLPFQNSIAHIREMVTIVRQILEENEVDFEGEFYTLKGATLGKLYEKPNVPIYLAALGPKMLELAGEIADGVLMNWVSPSYMKTAIQCIEKGAKKAKRSISSIEIACYIRVMVTDHPAKAEPSLRRLIARYTFMPDYRKFFEMMGYHEDVTKIAEAWKNNGKEAAEEAVSMAMIQDIAIVGSAEYCKQEIKRFNSWGIRKPVIAPFAEPTNALQTYSNTIRALARI